MLAFRVSLFRRFLDYWLADDRNKPTAAGAAIYSPLFLNAIYDKLVLGVYCRWAWGCPSTVIQGLYQSTITSALHSISGRQLRILDIGVGTGYFLANASPLSDSSRGGAFVTLFDLNPACLEAASSRCKAAHQEGVVVQKACGDFLAPAATSTTPAAENSIHTLLSAEKQFDCVFTTMLLHCLPGPPSRKAAALSSLARFVEPQHGVLAGVTILGSGVKHNWLGRFLMFWHNALGMFGNKEDSAVSFITPLKEAFADVQWQVVGTVLIFEAKGPKQ